MVSLILSCHRRVIYMLQKLFLIVSAKIGSSLCVYPQSCKIRKTTFPKLLKMINYQVTPFLNNVSFFESFCSFKIGCFTAITNASRFFLLRLFIVADIRTFHWKTRSGCWKRCLAGSESLFGFMLIPTSNNILFDFTYVIFLTRTDFLIDFTWRVSITAHTILPVRYQLHLNSKKDEHLNM